MLDYRRFDAITFDCYGTLIDWETGLVDAFSEALSGRHDPEHLLARFASHETRLEAGPYLTYREVLAESLRAIAREVRAAPTEQQVVDFAQSVGRWPPFSDTAAALRRLKARFRLGVITNCDDDLFAASNARLGINFDWVITAQQVGSYKPAEANFHAALSTLGLPRERVLHVAQSLFHDHVPATRLGITTVWIDRRAGKAGGGTTPPADATPAATFPDLASFADAALA